MATCERRISSRPAESTVRFPVTPGAFHPLALSTVVFQHPHCLLDVLRFAAPRRIVLELLSADFNRWEVHTFMFAAFQTTESSSPGGEGPPRTFGFSISP